MDDETKRRLTWVRLYEQMHDVGLTCRRCGITPPTLRKWLRRYEEQGEAGLVSQSRRPKSRPKSRPKQKVFDQEEAWILELRRERNLGARRIQQELRRLHGCRLSLETIHTISAWVIGVSGRGTKVPANGVGGLKSAEEYANNRT